MGDSETMTPFERRKAEVLQRIHGHKAPNESIHFLRIRELFAFLIFFLNVACFIYLMGFGFLLIIAFFYGGFAWIQEIIATKSLGVFDDSLSRGGGYFLMMVSVFLGLPSGVSMGYWIVISTGLLSRNQVWDFGSRLGRWGIFDFFKKWEKKELARHPFKK